MNAPPTLPRSEADVRLQRAVVPVCERCVKYYHDIDEADCDGDMRVGRKRKCARCAKHGHACLTITDPNLRNQALSLIKTRDALANLPLDAGQPQLNQLEEHLANLGGVVKETCRVLAANKDKSVGVLSTPCKGPSAGQQADSTLARGALREQQRANSIAAGLFELKYEALRLRGAAPVALQAALAARDWEEGADWVELPMPRLRGDDDDANDAPPGDNNDNDDDAIERPAEHQRTSGSVPAVAQPPAGARPDPVTPAAQRTQDVMQID